MGPHRPGEADDFGGPFALHREADEQRADVRGRGAPGHDFGHGGTGFIGREIFVPRQLLNQVREHHQESVREIDTEKVGSELMLALPSQFSLRPSRPLRSKATAVIRTRSWHRYPRESSAVFVVLRRSESIPDGTARRGWVSFDAAAP